MLSSMHVRQSGLLIVYSYIYRLISNIPHTVICIGLGGGGGADTKKQLPLIGDAHRLFSQRQNGLREISTGLST